MVVQKVIEALADELNVSYFWGGSRRFNFHNLNSDYDLFISIDRACMKFLDLVEATPTQITEYPGEHYETSIFGHDIDIIVLPPQEWGELCNEHKIIAELLESDIQTRDFCRVLKDNGVPGKTIYRSLKHLLIYKGMIH